MNIMSCNYAFRKIFSLERGNTLFNCNVKLRNAIIVTAFCVLTENHNMPRILLVDFIYYMCRHGEVPLLVN